MRVVIAGAGEVGYHVVGALYRESVEIAAIDSDPYVLELLRQEYNVSTFLGNATDTDTLDAAEVGKADLFLAITNFDETNIIACLMAAEAGARRKIARVRTIDAGQGRSVSERSHLGIDLIINPYEVAAEHLEQLVRHPQVTDHNQFLEDRVLLVRFPITAESPLAHTDLIRFGRDAHIPHTLIALIQRQGHSLIPDAGEVIRPGDQVYFFCEKGQLGRLSRYLGLGTRPSRRVFINGGGHIGFSLARRLEHETPDVRLMEISEDRCHALSQTLDRTLVLNADGSQSMSLKAEGVDHTDTFLSVTNQDQINIVSCMLAKQAGAPRTIALAKQPEYIPILMNRRLVDVAFSPRLLTALKLLRFVRGESLQAFFSFPNSDVELLEVHIAPGAACEDRPLASLDLPRGFLIGAVKRGEELFIPHGEHRLQAGDRVLIIQQRRNRRVANHYFLSPSPPGTGPGAAPARPGAGPPG